jgi:hypothetical protein
LVGDDDEAIAMRMQPAQTFYRSRLELQSRWVIEVATVNHQGTVAVEDNDLFGDVPTTHETEEPV